MKNLGIIPDFIKRWYMPETKRTQAEWTQVEAEQERREQIVKQARGMMSQAAKQYRDSVRVLKGKELVDFTKTQSPKLIMSVMHGVTELMAMLDDQETWDMLKRPEQRYLADVYKAMGGRK